MQFFFIGLTTLSSVQLIAWLFGLDNYATPIKVVALGSLAIVAAILTLVLSFESRFDGLMNHLKKRD